MKLKAKKIEKLVQTIADRLMTGGQNVKAIRLQIRGPNEENLGGNCRKSVENVIRSAIEDIIRRK